MRCTPLAVWSSNLDSRDNKKKAVILDAELTHPNILV
jgi:hypothetical protein